MRICSCVIFLLRDQWMIEDWAKRRLQESSDECTGGGFGRQRLFANSIEKFNHMNTKSDSSRPEIYKALKLFWLSNGVSIARVVARFPHASRSRPAATTADPGTPCYFAGPFDQPKLCRSAGSKAQPLILQSKPSIAFSIVFLNSLRE